MRSPLGDSQEGATITFFLWVIRMTMSRGKTQVSEGRAKAVEPNSPDPIL